MKRTYSQATADDESSSTSRSVSQDSAHEYGQLGIIESVKLRNFMCHENLSFDFDPHINFIVGRNGSGKSAILTGIILALGGKSSATGRFSNIKGFVKTGKNTASVSVTLKNCGLDAYKPEEYGEKITIERHFTLDGVNSYKIKSEGGRIISTSKDELTNILNVMDIQIENPVTVLGQDASKNFLVSKTSKGDKLYKLFYEGTGLSKIYNDYNRALQQSQDAKADLQNKKAVLLDMEKDMKDIKKLLDKSAKIHDLEKELFWAIVIKLEKERDEAVQALEKVEKDVSNLNKMLDRQTAELAEISQKIDAARSDKKESQDKIVEIRKHLESYNSLKSVLMSEIREIEGTCSRHEREIAKIENEILSLKKVMDMIRMQNQQDLAKEKEKHELVMEDLKIAITDTQANIVTLNDKKSENRNREASLKFSLDTCQAEIQDLTNEKGRIEREKQQIINGMKNRLSVFGTEMQDVMKEIKIGVDSRRFKKTPIGPIGYFIDVKKPEWTFAIQECLKMALLKSFICDNHEDADQLSTIFSRYFQRQRPSIIISKFSSEVYDVSAHKCVCQYPTVLDMLNIKMPDVANCLIDQKQIENILLVEDSVEARNLMLHNPPKKCCYVYSCNGDQFYHSPVRKYSCRNKNQLCILKSFQDDDLKNKEEETERVNNSLSEKVQLKNKLTNQYLLLQKESEELSQKIMELKSKENRLFMKLKDEESSFVEPKDINNLHSDFDKLQRDKADHEGRLSSCKSILTTKMEELNVLDENLEECKRSLRKESENFQVLTKNVADYESRKEKLTSSCKKIRSNLGQLQEGLDEKQQNVANCVATVKVSTETALKTCERIDTRRSCETLRNLITEMKNCLHKQKKLDREALFKEYKEKVDNINKARTELFRQEEINERYRPCIQTDIQNRYSEQADIQKVYSESMRLIKMIAQRFKEFQKIRDNTSISLTCFFMSLLKGNNFTGHTAFDPEAQTLEIFAKPENSDLKFGDKPNLSQLSGGERSFVTIAFLLSLWDRIHSPFRILDEYDVFMDSNNRHMSIHLLINTAESNKKVQYIFLSPLELPPIEHSCHVKVHKMPDPRS